MIFNVKSPRLFNNLDPNVKPIATKSRRFNKTDQSFIEKEVRQLLAEGIIEPSYSPWYAQVLVIEQGFPNFFMNVSLKQFQKLTVPVQHKN